MENSEPSRSLRWAHGSLTVQRLGAMLAPVRFQLPNGQTAEPLHMPPWANDPLPKDVPAILRGLRGEWPCVPFGADEPRSLDGDWQNSLGRPSALPPYAPPHGESSNCLWDWLERGENCLALRLDYPVDHPIAWVEREIIALLGAAAIDLVLRIMPRKDCRLPIGLHPTFALPDEFGTAKIAAPKAAHIRTYPGSIEPNADIFAADAWCDDLIDAPAHAGGRFDASRVPFANRGEDLLQLVGVEEGQVSLENLAAGSRTTLTWNAEHFPSLLIWYSNRGRQHEPWNARHIALGLEPICSAFDLGDALSNGDNPIARAGVPTAHPFQCGILFETRYRLSAETL